MLSRVVLNCRVEVEAKISSECQGRRQHRHRMILLQFCRSFMSRWKQRPQVNVREEDNTDIGWFQDVQMEAKISTRWQRKTSEGSIGLCWSDPLTVLSKFYVYVSSDDPLRSFMWKQRSQVNVRGEDNIDIGWSSHSSVEVLCPDGSKDLKWMSGKKTTRISADFQYGSVRSFMSRWKQRSQLDDREEDNVHIG